MRRFLLLFALCLLPLAAAEDEQKLEDLVSQLGDDDFKQRQEASDILMKRIERDPGLANSLKRFAGHEDPEVRFRIGELTKDLPLLLKWIDPSLEMRLHSKRDGNNPLKLTVKNRSKVEIQTHWLDWDGNRQPRRNLKPGEEIVIARTYEAHPWLLTNIKGKALGIYIPKGDKQVLIIYTGNEGGKE